MVKTTEFNVQTQMNYVVGNMSGFTAAYTGMDNLSALISSLMTSYTTMAGTGRAAYLSLGAAVSAFGLKSAEAFGEYQRGMNMVKAISNNTNAQMQMLSQSAQQFSSQFRMGIEDINSGLVTLGRAGLTDVNNQIEVLKNGLQVAKISGMDLASTLEDIVTTTSLLGGDIKSNTFGAETKEISNLLVATSLSGPLNVSDVIETLKFAGGSAAAAGATLNNEEGLHDLLGTIGAFSQKGVTGSIAGTALRAFITKPASQDQKVSDALAKLGLDAYSLWEKDPEQGWHMKPIAEQIGLITKAMDKNHLTNLDRIEVWGDIVGNKMGQQMLKLDERRIKETTKDIEHQRNLEKIYQGTLTNFASQVERLNQIFQAIYRNFGSQFASTLTPIVNFLADVAEFVNGFGNGAIIKIIASAVGPLGLAGLAKGLRDFIQVLGALKANIIESSEKSLGSQDLWVAQRGVIEKRMNKGETIIAHDEWDKFLKQKSSRTSHRETDEEYKARMAQREADYKARQDAKDKDAQKRQNQRDEEYRKNQEQRNQLYQEHLQRLTKMSVGAHTVSVFGSAVYLDAPRGNGTAQSLPVTPMSEDTAKQIIDGQKKVAMDAASEQTQVFTSYKHDMNNMIARQGNINTAFTNVDPYSITLRHDYDIENGIYKEQFLKDLVEIENMMRSVMGVAMVMDSESRLFRGDLGKDVTKLYVDSDAMEGMANIFSQHGDIDMDPNMFGRAIQREIGAMVDNFNKHGTYQHLFTTNDDKTISVQEGQEEIFTREVLKRAVGFMGNHLLNNFRLDDIFSADADLDNIFSKDELKRISEKNNYVPLHLALSKGMEMRGFNAYMAGFESMDMEKGVLEGLRDKYLFTHLGLLSQNTEALGTIVTDMNTAFQGLELNELTQNEFNSILTAAKTFSAQIHEQMKIAGELAVTGWRTGTGIWSPGYIYTYTAQEFRGIKALLTQFRSTTEIGGELLGEKMINGFQSSLKSKGQFNALVDEWFNAGYINEKTKAALKSSDTKMSTLKQLNALMNDDRVDNIKARRFGEEKIGSLYPSLFGDDRKPLVRKGEFVVIDTESNTMSDSSQKQITQYTQRHSPGEHDDVIDMYIDSANSMSKNASILTGITDEIKAKGTAETEAYNEATAYYNIINHLLDVIGNDKAIVAHNAAYDKSNIISNLTRVASNGLLDDKEFLINGKAINAYDAIQMIDQARWIDTEKEVSPYKNAQKINGDFIFWDDVAKTIRTKNSIVFEALTGKNVDPEKVHNAKYDTYLTYAIMDVLTRALNGELLSGKTWMDDVSDHDEYGRDINGNKSIYRRDYEEFKKNEDEYFAKAINKGQYRTGKITRNSVPRPIREGREAVEDDKWFVTEASHEKETFDLLNSYNFDNFKKIPINQATTGIGMAVEFLMDNQHFQDLAEKEDTLKDALEAWAEDPREYGATGLFERNSGHLAQRILDFYNNKDEDRLFWEGVEVNTLEDMSLDDLRKSWYNDTLGLEHLNFYKRPHNDDAKAILQAIKNKLMQPYIDEQIQIPDSILRAVQGGGFSQDRIANMVQTMGINSATRKNILYNNKPLEDIYNVVQGSMLSQDQILAMMARGKLFTKDNRSIGYIDDEGEFKSLIHYDDLSDQEQVFVDKHGMEALSNEYFQSNEVEDDSLENYVAPVGKGFSMKKTSPFNKNVMEYMGDRLPDLVEKYNKAMGEDILDLQDDNIIVKSPMNNAQRIENELRDLEQLFYGRFKDDVVYFSEKIGGKTLTDNAYHTFDTLPGVRELLDDYIVASGGENYKFLHDINEEREKMQLKIAQKEAGDAKAAADLARIKSENNFMKEGGWENDPRRRKKVQRFKKDYDRAKYDYDFDNPINANLMGNYVLSHHKYRLGAGANPHNDFFNLMNEDIKNIANQGLSTKQFYKAISEFPVFVQNMIHRIINVESNSFREAMTILGEKGVEGFRDGTRMRSPPAVITEFLGYIRELPDYVLASSAHFQQAASSLGKAFITGFEGSIQNIQFFTTLQENPALLSSLRHQMRLNHSSSPSSNIQKYFDEVGIKALDLSSLYNQGNITQTSYLDQLYKQIGINLKKDLMTPQQFKSEIAKIKEDLFNRNITSAQAKTRTQQLTAQYEDDQRVQGIRDRAISNEQFTTSVKALEAQYKNSAITLEEYIEKTMRLMGVEERRLMTEDDLANKLIDIKNKLAAGEITEVEAEQGSAHLINQFEDDKGTLKQNEIKQKRQDRINKGGIRGAAWGKIYNVTDSISKVGGIGGLANSLFSFMMNPIVMLGQMIMGWLQQFFDMVKQAEQEKIAKLSEIMSDAASAFEDQQSKWEEAQSKNNEKFNDLSDNEKQDQMLDAIANARDDLNNASAETKVLLGKQNSLITANNNMIQTKSDQWLTGFNGWEANYTEFMEGSGMYGTKDEYGFMDFLEGIINPDKFEDNSNTRRIEALAESSIQIDTRVKNMEEFTEDYQQVMASLGIAGRSILDIYNVRGIIDESLMSGTFFDQSPSNSMRIGAPGLMSAEKLAGLMKTQEKILTRFENRYLRFVKTSTGQGNRIGVTLGDGSIHQLANQLGVKDIEAAQMLAVHELQRIQDVMINQVAPQLSEQTLSLYNGTYDLTQQTQYDNVQTAFQNTMQQGIWAIQGQVAQLVYKATMEQALADYQAETGDTETNTIGLLLNRARDTTSEFHDAAQKYASRGWGSFLEGRDINKLINEGYTQEQAIQKLAEEKGVSVDKLTEAYAKENYSKLSEYEYNGQEEWVKRHAGQLLMLGGTIVGGVAGTALFPGGGTILGAEIGATAGTAIGGAIGAAGGAAAGSLAAGAYQGINDGLVDFTDPFTAHTNEMMKSYAASVPIDETIKTLNDAQTAADEEGNNGKDTDDSDANKQRYVQLAICNKKAIPKLNVNLFKKAPTFTVLNKNFKLRDIKINTADKAKNIENSLKNAIIDVQERSDPKIIQDSEGEYDPVGATDDATNLPTGASLTK